MRKILLIIMLLILTGCGGVSVKQKEKDLVIGETYTVNDLFETQDKDAKLYFDKKSIKPTSKGEMEVVLHIEKNDKITDKKYTFNSLDITAPKINQIKEKHTIGELFDINNFIEVTDDVDLTHELVINIEHSNLDENVAGTYTVTVSAQDKSLNQSVTEIDIIVAEPYVDIKVGDTIDTTDQDAEMLLKLNSVGYQETIKTYSTNMFASYYSDSKDETYIVFKTTVKNIGGTNIGYYDIDDCNIIYSDKYEYNLYQLDTNSSACSEFWSLAPLKSQDVFFFGMIPNELKGKSFKAYFEINGITYLYTHNA